MRRKRYLAMIGLLALTGCGEDAAEIADSSEASSVDEYPLRKDYVATDKLTFAKDVSMDKVASYCEDHKADDGWPRVRKYAYADLDQYDDEWSVMAAYKAAYCYKYYNGRNYSNGNLFYMSEVYVLPEVEKFALRYNFYEYKDVTIGPTTVGYSTYQTYVTFSFGINEKAEDVELGGIWAYRTVKLTGEIASTNSFAFLYEVKNMVPPSTLAYAADVTYKYAINDPSAASGIDSDFLNEKAAWVYRYLKGQTSFVDGFLKLVSSSYALISK